MRIYGTINKVTEQDDGTLLVEGVASSPAKDTDGEVITAEAIKNAIPDYMKFANVREMHDSKKAAGIATEMDVNAAGLAMMTALVVDPIAIAKVKSGVYKGFSVAGKVTSRDKVDKSIITGLDLYEISLVDRPANPDAVFSCYKVDGKGPEDEQEDAPPIEEPPVEDVQKVDEPVVVAPTEVDVDGVKVLLRKNADGKFEIVEDIIKKGCYSISQLAQLCMMLEDFAYYEDFDSAMEGDKSTVPATARKLCKQLYDLLLTLVAEDVSEAQQRLKDASKAAEPVDLQKVAGGGDGEEELKKVSGERDELQKAVNTVTAERDELQKKFDALPVAPKGVLISKANDRGEVEEVEVPLPSDPVERGVLLTKAAHQKPIRLM